MRCALVIALIVAAAPACSDRKPSPPPASDAGRSRRVIEHPRSAVYSLPPHLIQPQAMGPYKLGAALASVLYAIPAGPGVEVLAIENPNSTTRVVRLSVIRVEDDRMVVGGDSTVTTFVSVVAPEVARTEAGIEVGSTRTALIEALGAPVIDPVRSVDPRLIAVRPLPGVRFVVEADKIVAAILTSPSPEAGAGSAAPPATAPECKIDRSDDAAAALRSAFGGTPSRIDCLTADEAVGAVDDDIVVIAAGDKPRKLHSMHVPGLVYAGTTHASGKDEVIAVAARRTDRQVTWTVIAARWEAGRLTKLLDDTAYQLTDQSASWLGARLEDLDLLLDVEARTDVLYTSGVLLRRAGSAIRLAVPLAPISLARRKRTVTDMGPTGGGDASVQPLGDASTGTDAAPP